MSFGARLSKALSDVTSSQAELARKAEVSAPTISDWVRDEVQPDNVKAMPLLKAAAFLRVDPLWLLTGKIGKYPAPQSQTHTQSQLHEAPPRPFNSNWPFERVSPETYQRLPEAVRDQIASFVDGAVVGARSRPEA